MSNKKNFNKKKRNGLINYILLFGILLISINFISAIFIDSCQTLSSANTIYELNQSIVNNGLLVNCIIISANNITFNCNGYFISSVNNVSGVFSNFANTTVKNCNITMGGGTVINTNARGIYIDANGGTIINNTLNVTNGYGLYIANPNKIVINNSINSVSSVGMLQSTSSNGFVFNNSIISRSGIAYQLLNSANNTLDSNFIMSNTFSAIYVQGSNNNTIKNNIMIGNSSGSFGITVASSSLNNLIKDCVNIIGFNKDVLVTGTSLNTTFLNCSYSLAKEQVDSGSQLFRRWYYRAYANNSVGLPLSNVSVSVYDKFNILRFFELTNSSGFTSVYNILDYESISGVRNFSSNYTMIANSSLSSLQKSENITLLNNNILDVFTFISDPIITFVSQIPADVNSVNIFSNPLNITYFINGTFPLNQSSISIYYKTNKTNSETIYYVNGTATSGFQQKSYTSNSSDNYLFRLFDNQVYPATYNINETLMENTVHTLQTLTTASDYASVELLNVNNSSQYSFFEIMANRTTGATALRYYYCNFSYVFGVSSAPAINSNCVEYFSDTDGTYNHTHTQYSSHKIASFPINTTIGSIGGIKITPVSYFMIRGATNWQYYYINDTSRTNAIRLTNNNAVSWNNQNYTIDAHLHQFSSNETLWYYVCANDYFNNPICSSLRNDLLELAGLLPSSPIVYNPFTAFYHNIFAINYTASISPNNYAVNFYNITLLNLNFTFNQTIIANNSNNLSYLFNSSLVSDGFYIIKITACDILNQCSNGFSSYFEIDNTAPYGDLIDPVNNSFLNDANVNFTINAFDNGSLGNLTLNIRYPNGTLVYQETIITNQTSGIFGIVYTFLSNGVFEWFYTIYDMAGNFFQTVIRTLTIVGIPVVSISYPINNTNYNFTVSQLDYSISNADYCWYSLDNGITNISSVCGSNSITGIFSDNGINIWSVYANNSFGNESVARVVFNSTCANPNIILQLDSYPYVDLNSSYNIKVSSFPYGTSNIKMQLTDPDNIINIYNMTYDNVSSYGINFVFLQEGSYSFVIFGDGICPTVITNITGNFIVKNPYFVSVCGFSDKTGTAYKNEFAYLTAEFISPKYNADLDQFITPLGFATTFKTSVFHTTYDNGCGTLKLYEPNATYVFRLIDGEITFPTSYSVPNMTKSYGTNIQLGQFKMNGTSENLNVYLSAKDINPYFWIFNWIMIIAIIGIIIISVFLFFVLSDRPQFALIFFIIMILGIVITRIIIWFYVG